MAARYLTRDTRYRSAHSGATVPDSHRVPYAVMRGHKHTPAEFHVKRFNDLHVPGEICIWLAVRFARPRWDRKSPYKSSSEPPWFPRQESRYEIERCCQTSTDDDSTGSDVARAGGAIRAQIIVVGGAESGANPVRSRHCETPPDGFRRRRCESDPPAYLTQTGTRDPRGGAQMPETVESSPPSTCSAGWRAPGTARTGGSSEPCPR